MMELPAALLAKVVMAGNCHPEVGRLGFLRSVGFQSEIIMLSLREEASLRKEYALYLYCAIPHWELANHRSSCDYG